MVKKQLKAKFQKKLNLFCFFHLGSDAQVKVSEQENQLRILINHHRVEPFEFTVSYSQLEELLSDSVELERFMLNEVTPHRR